MVNKVYRRLLMIDSQPRNNGAPTPATAPGATPTNITAVPGLGYVTGARAGLYDIATGTEVACTVPVVGSATTFTCTTPVTTPGAKRLVVRNPDGEVASVPFTCT